MVKKCIGFAQNNTCGAILILYDLLDGGDWSSGWGKTLLLGGGCGCWVFFAEYDYAGRWHELEIIGGDGVGGIGVRIGRGAGFDGVEVFCAADSAAVDESSGDAGCV
jgi:hypothetical protein